MNKRHLSLFTAVTSTACAVIWLANCVVDAIYGIDSVWQIALHVLCTAVWTASAAMWWVRWRKERPEGRDAQAS